MIYDREADETPSEAVVTAVAAATDRSLFELEPLGEALDPDALNSLFRRADSTGSSITVSFVYADCDVTVSPDDVRVIQE